MTFEPCDFCKARMLIGTKMCLSCIVSWREWMNRSDEEDDK